MRTTVHIILLVFAFVCFILAAIKSTSRVDLTAAGLAFLVASSLF